MTNQKSTKRALLLSALSLLICVAMLIGSTYAWFTDSVTSGSNKIQSGNLDIKLLMHDGSKYVDISESSDSIFGAGSIAQNNNAETLWEPGKTQVAYLAIENAGNLSLKYKVALDVYTTTIDHKNLYEVMQYAIVPDAQPDSVDKWNGGKSVVLGKQVVSGDGIIVDVTMEPGVTHYFALAIHMLESADNKYQGGEVSFDMSVLATQVEAEFDSFDNTYDADATYPMGKPSKVSETAGEYIAVIDIPKEAPEGNYTLDFPEDKISVSYNDTKATFNCEIDLLRDGVKVENTGMAWPVSINLPHPFVKVEKILHNGEEIKDFTFDATNYTVEFVTTHFSPFAITYTDYTDPSFELDFTDIDGKYTITKGMFVNKNPIDFDPSLAEADSKYMVVDFVKDGHTYYVVSERENTVIIGDNSATYSKYNAGTGLYSFKNGNYPVSMINDNQLYTYLDANGTVYKTVLLLPGTYTEATTLTVNTDKDIIGLGNPEEIKVIKEAVHTIKNKVSNRHLFNCTNDDSTKYIQVTIRNLALDATEKNSYIVKFLGKDKQMFDDNAAVQSIRRAKVKCYDLIVEKIANDASSIAFYVNSTNKVDDGKTYPAYMYVENTVVNSEKANGVADAKATNSYLYYNNLYYNGGATQYIQTGTNIENTVMAADDWWN